MIFKEEMALKCSEWQLDLNNMVGCIQFSFHFWLQCACRFSFIPLLFISASNPVLLTYHVALQVFGTSICGRFNKLLSPANVGSKGEWNVFLSLWYLFHVNCVSFSFFKGSSPLSNWDLLLNLHVITRNAGHCAMLQVWRLSADMWVSVKIIKQRKTGLRCSPSSLLLPWKRTISFCAVWQEWRCGWREKEKEEICY